jgi:hypothetical protein
MPRTTILLAVPFLLLVACGHQTTHGDGPTSSLQRSAGPPTFYLDVLSGIALPMTHPSVSVGASADLSGSGWAADDQNKAPAGGVDIAIDGQPFRTQYGAERPDVAAHFNLPAYTKTGFQFLIPGGTFSAGNHKLTVRVISSDGKTYRESDPLTLVIQ